MYKYLAIVGASGVGKTSLMHNLINNYPSKFVKVEQCTTRDIRDNEVGDAYVWLDSKRDYDKLKHLFIAKTEIRGNYYGSIPLQDQDKIGIIILNEMGTKYFINDIERLNNEGGIQSQYYIIGLDKSDISCKRIGRDEEYVKQERKVLQYADFIYTLDNNKYANPEEVMEEVIAYFEQQK